MLAIRTLQSSVSPATPCKQTTRTNSADTVTLPTTSSSTEIKVHMNKADAIPLKDEATFGRPQKAE
jgi:hypothetical protein